MYNIGIIGNGFVGAAISAGFGLHSNIRAYDINPKKSTHTLEETVNKSDFIFVSVPTPMKSALGGEMDCSIIFSVFDKIREINKRDDNIFIIKSTTIPGTTEKIIGRYDGLKIVYSPEFLTERTARLDFINASRIILGGAKDHCDQVENLFRTRFPFVKIIKTDVTTAQFIKYMCNCFFATKVTYMNEMKQGADRLGVDWDATMEAFVADGRIGNSHLDVPGHDGSVGFGGKCFPKDINAFIGLYNAIEVFPTVMEAVWKKNLEVRENHDWNEIEGAVSQKNT
jgi:nucleotide sugar dehydrogenase